MMHLRASMLVLLLVGLGCGSDESGAASDGSTTASSSAATGATADEGADASDTDTGAAPMCEVLFGNPAPSTGLSEEQCRPQCDCLEDGPWVAPIYDADDWAALRAMTLQNPPGELTEDPYQSDTPPDPIDPESVCAVTLDATDPQAYRLDTFATDTEAEAAGAKVTHSGVCGRCSSLANLAVYMENPDLTEPVRACALLGLTESTEANLNCLLDLGFELPCAQIWLYNSDHTRAECLTECLDDLEAPYHLPDGSLNPCLQCDEEKSGDVFKFFAGRTRRNTGLPSALCRPCDEVRPIVHEY